VGTKVAVTEGGMQWALIPIWLAKKWGYYITIETKPVKAKSGIYQQCCATITTHIYMPPLCVNCEPDRLTYYNQPVICQTITST
jgi:hypothetical protein